MFCVHTMKGNIGAAGYGSQQQPAGPLPAASTASPAGVIASAGRLVAANLHQVFHCGVDGLV